MRTINHTLARFTGIAPLVLRVVLGALMAYHGQQKFANGIDGVEGFFDSIGVPAPGLAAPLVAAIELVAGLALIVGLLTRISAAALALVLAGALHYVKLDLGVIAAGDAPMPGAELDLALIAGLIALVVVGPGPLSIDRAVGVEDGEVLDLSVSPVDASEPARL